MSQPILKLPYKGKLLCTQESNSKDDKSHSSKYKNTKYALDFTIDNKNSFEILASTDGQVKIWRCCNHKSGNCKCGLGFGNQIRLYNDEYFTFYAHLGKIFVKNGQFVKQGQVIGLAGNTGLAGTVHLHWTLGIESKENKPIEGKFIPFESIKARNVEIKFKNKKKSVSGSYFKEEIFYSSTNKKLPLNILK